MRIIITTDTALAFMRRAGYGFQKEGSGEAAFVRRVGASPFPRYHAYVTEREGQASGVRRQVLTINLHVDQKAPTYQRGRTHAGEYDGALVEEEAARLRAFVSASPPTESETLETKKGFFGRLFG